MVGFTFVQGLIEMIGMCRISSKNAEAPCVFFLAIGGARRTIDPAPISPLISPSKRRVTLPIQRAGLFKRVSHPPSLDIFPHLHRRKLKKKKKKKRKQTGCHFVPQHPLSPLISLTDIKSSFPFFPYSSSFNTIQFNSIQLK